MTEILDKSEKLYDLIEISEQNEILWNNFTYMKKYNTFEKKFDKIEEISKKKIFLLIYQYF